MAVSAMGVKAQPNVDFPNRTLRNGMSSVNENTSSPAATRLNTTFPTINHEYGRRNPSSRRYIAPEPGGRRIRFGALAEFVMSVTREIYCGRSATRRSTFRSVRPPRQPYALDTPGFAFAAIATFAARAPLGGPREIALAAFVTARLADDVAPRARRSPPRRRGPRGSARRWLTTLAIAEPIRKAFVDLATATETDAPTTAAALRRVIEVTASVLDLPSRSDLERLARELDSQAVART